jgi:hypothetical protein
MRVPVGVNGSPRTSRIFRNKGVAPERLPMILRTTTRRKRRKLNVRIGPRKIHRGCLFAVIAAIVPARRLGKYHGRCAAHREPRVPLVKSDVLFRMLVSLVAHGIAEDVVYATLIPALVRVVVAEAQRQAIPEPEGSKDRVVVRHVSVEPRNITLGSLVPIVVIPKCI